jgi:hypothetical protein
MTVAQDKRNAVIGFGFGNGQSIDPGWVNQVKMEVDVTNKVLKTTCLMIRFIVKW